MWCSPAGFELTDPKSQGTLQSSFFEYLELLDQQTFCRQAFEVFVEFAGAFGASHVTYHFGVVAGHLDLVTSLEGESILDSAQNVGCSVASPFIEFLKGRRPVLHDHGHNRPYYNGLWSDPAPEGLGEEWSVFQHQLAKFELMNMITIPLQGPGLTTRGAITLHGPSGQTVEMVVEGVGGPAGLTELMAASLHFHLQYQAILAAEEPLVATLSDRQVDILLKLGWGREQKQIAQELGLSTPAIKYHVAEINRKMGTSHIIASVAKATKLGLIQP